MEKKESVCRDNATRVAEFDENFKPGRWSFLGLGDKEKRYGSSIDRPLGEWNSTAETVMQEFAESGVREVEKFQVTTMQNQLLLTIVSICSVFTES